jgi:hypothetical protein
LRNQASARARIALTGRRAPDPISHVSASARRRDATLALTMPLLSLVTSVGSGLGYNTN